MKGTLTGAEVWVCLIDETGQDATCLSIEGVFSMWRAISEDIWFGRMSVKVKKNFNLFGLETFSYAS